MPKIGVVRTTCVNSYCSPLIGQASCPSQVTFADGIFNACRAPASLFSVALFSVATLKVFRSLGLRPLV